MTILAELGWVESSPGVWVNPSPPEPSYPHPMYGTCVPECPLYGECHCMCGTPSKLAKSNWPAKGNIIRQPFVFHVGHNPRTVSNLAPFAVRGHPYFSRSDSLHPSEVLPLLKWLEDKYGTQKTVAQLLGLNRNHYSKLRAGYYSVVKAKTWRRVQELVLAHKTPSDPFATYEERRVIPTQERAHLDRLMRRARDREAQRELRAKKRAM